MEKPSIESNAISTVGSTTAPTTFVQADAHTFRELVQKLTGVADDTVEKLPITVPARYSARAPNCSSTGGEIGGPRRSAFKLQERRHNMRKLEIKLGLTSIRGSGSFSPRSQPLISPITSPVTPLGSDTLFSQLSMSGSESSPLSSPAVLEEEKAIADKGFYLHPSPLSTPRVSDPPELLPLFPLHSPREAE